MRGTTVEFQVQTSNLAIVLAATSCPTKTNKAHEVTPPVPSQLEMCARARACVTQTEEKSEYERTDICSRNW